MATVIQQELYGGAITINLPSKFGTISHVREVPDHQEVFVNVDEDQSVIVEILELAAEASDDNCAATVKMGMQIEYVKLVHVE
ncbi:hypothetical protein EC957_001373 [Mortierella hygrophila]|uniref:Uncharacterized protein n=1 Tax=Mortierella hygrophila TaxID=979708 RepID=A0A9P6F5P1_9FUNG|nr:hypothetical protein EC957_001373 [Mortierella hygrophila]